MSIKGNTYYNLAGNLVPVAVSLITVPLYLHLIGDARYGIIAIVWMFLGYFGFFDLGLSRATANRIAQLHEAPAIERERVFWTALGLNASFGVIGGLVLYFVAGFMLAHFFTMPSELRGEVLSTMPWLAAMVPLATMSGVLTGAIEARERFLSLNIIQVAGTILLQTAPLVVANIHGPSLRWIIPAAILANATSAVALMILAAKVLPIHGAVGFSRAQVKPLLVYGVWVTVTNLVGPILATFDRILVGFVLGASSLAYYTVGYNLANRATVLPGALMRSLFPRLSMQTDEYETKRLSGEAARVIITLMTPLIVLGICLMKPFLSLWISDGFAAKSAPVGEMILLGVWINSLAFVPYTQLQARGRPHLVATFHAIELVPFLLVLWIGLSTMGLIGAATAWSLRVVVDAALLFWASGLGWGSLKYLWPSMGLVLGAWAGTQWLGDVTARLGVDIFLIAAASIWAMQTEPRWAMQIINSSRKMSSMFKFGR